MDPLAQLLQKAIDMRPLRLWSQALFLFLALTATGCQSDSCSDGRSGGAAFDGSSARCVGQAVEAYDVNDAESCFKQGSEWDSVNLECRGTTFSVSCSRADESGRPPQAMKEMCLDIPGCGWTEDDGAITYPAGQCVGQKLACAGFASETCESQPGCIYFSNDGCVDKNGFNWLDNADCEYLQIADDVSFSVVKSACERAQGCTWLQPEENAEGPAQEDADTDSQDATRPCGAEQDAEPPGGGPAPPAPPGAP